MTINENMLQIRQRINAACQRAGRNPATVQLMAVSKTKPATMVQEAVNAGQLLFGENYVQEARDKIPLVHGEKITWHLIGPLQRNKVKTAVTLFSMIHTVDSLELAQEINRRTEHPMPVLLEVNMGREPQKHGFLPEEVEQILPLLATMPGIQVQGLMAIPPLVADAETSRPYFRALSTLAARLNSMNLNAVSMTELSMGMSHDFEVAVEEGATIVRVGSALFGARG